MIRFLHRLGLYRLPDPFGARRRWLADELMRMLPYEYHQCIQMAVMDTEFREQGFDTWPIR